MTGRLGLSFQDLRQQFSLSVSPDMLSGEMKGGKGAIDLKEIFQFLRQTLKTVTTQKVKKSEIYDAEGEKVCCGLVATPESCAFLLGSRRQYHH